MRAGPVFFSASADTTAREAILDCRALDEPAEAWRRRHGIERRHTLPAAPLDKPNSVLILRDNSSVRLTHLGVARAGLACVFLYLDQPHTLVAALGRP